MLFGSTSTAKRERLPPPLNICVLLSRSVVELVRLPWILSKFLSLIWSANCKLTPRVWLESS